MFNLLLSTFIHLAASDPFFVPAPGITWNNAKAGCEALSTSLITLGGYKNEDGISCWADFSSDELKQNPKLWIGAYWDDTNGWLWTENDSPFLCPTQTISQCDARLKIRNNYDDSMFLAGLDGNVNSRSKTKTTNIVGYCCNSNILFCPEWNQIQGSYKHVSAASDGTVWSVDNTNTILRLESLFFNNEPIWTSFNGNNWKMVDVGKSNPIGDASENIIFAVEDSDYSNMYRRLFSTPYRWHNEGLSPYGTGYTHVSAASDNTVWMIDTNKRVYRRDRGHTPPIEIQGQYLDYVSVASNTQIWGVLLVNGVIYERDTTANIWINHGNAPNNEKFTYVSVAEDGTVFAITENDKIYNYQGDMWERVCGSLKQVSVSSINEAWGVDANGNMLYFRN